MDVSEIRIRVAAMTAVCAAVCASGCQRPGSFVDYASLPNPGLTSAFSTTSVVTNAEPSVDDPGNETPAPAVDPPTATDETSAQSGGSQQAVKPDSAVSPPATGKTSTEPSSANGSGIAQVRQVAGVREDINPLNVGVRMSPTGERLPDPAGEGVESPAEPLEIKLLVPTKSFRPEGEDDVLRVSYDDIDLLKILNMEPVPPDADRHFPDWLRQLDGQRIRIRGFMYPTFKATGLTGFTLARDNGICCFVRQPKVYDVIAIKLAKGETTHYIDNKPFDVEGTFRIVPEADDTELFQLYRIENAHVLN
ncbi:MAG: hypothetical protein R3C49_20015 [Planctomycetaceae bacterium]